MQCLSPEKIIDTASASAHFCRHLEGKAFGYKVVVLRTMCNGWATSDRYHEFVRHRCFFGCNLFFPKPRDSCIKKDTLSHYLACPVFLRILRALFYSDISYTPLNLLHFSSLDLHVEVFIAHSIYHHLKHEHLPLVSCIKNFADLQKVIVVALAYGKDLLEHEFPKVYKDIYGFQTPDALSLVVSSS